MPDTIRAAVVGCGGRGRLYARLAQAMPELHMVAYADVRAESAEAALSEYGGDYATTDLDRIWADSSLDAVILSTWHDTHTPYAVAAAKAGKHIFIEKPLALTVAECETIGAAVERAGVVLVTGFKLHCCPLVPVVVERIGTPWLVVGQMMDSPWPATHWATQPGTGGGNVLSQGCHTADLVRVLAGGEPVRVHGEGGVFSGQHPEVVDNVVATVAFDNGAVAAIVQGDLGQNPSVSKFFFQAWGRNGVGVQMDSRLHRAVFFGRNGVEEVRAADLAGTDDVQVIEGDVGVLRSFVDAVLGRGPAEPGLHAATQATRIMSGIVESVQTGKSVAW